MIKNPPSMKKVHIAINREGGLFIFFLIALAGGAIYSGKSGLMLLFCCIFAAFVIALIIAKINFKQTLSLERRFIEEIFAGRDTRIDVIIKNKGSQPVYGLHIYERFEGNSTIGPMFLRRIAPGETASARYMCLFQQRGNAHFCGFQIRSRFPLPFIELRADIDIEDYIPVYPQPIPETNLIAFAESVSDRHAKQIHRKDKTIRELVHGRRSGRILWKLSARKQVWIEEAPIHLKTNLGIPVIQLLDKTHLGPEKYEQQISQITAFILNQIQHDVSGEIQIGNTLYSYGKSPVQRREILETLAYI